MSDSGCIKWCKSDFCHHFSCCLHKFQPSFYYPPQNIASFILSVILAFCIHPSLALILLHPSQYLLVIAFGLY